jgi:hypothetical protein
MFDLNRLPLAGGFCFCAALYLSRQPARAEAS